MSHGLVLGKFMPPHRGHLYLVDFARSFADEVTIVVGSLSGEPIAGALRHQWMSQLCPQCRVVHLTDENPQYPEEHPDFWNIWRSSLQRVVGRPLDFVFASEDYGRRLAQELGARFIPSGGLRSHIPISATEIRNNPWRHWDCLPRLVRPYYLGRIAIFGPESTGKTTLTRRLAEHFGTAWVPEFARTWLEGQQGQVSLEDMVIIARGQVASEEALAYQADRLLFCDTDPAATLLWSQELFGQIPSEVAALAHGRRYDLTLLLAPDVPWVEDLVRYRPKGGEAFWLGCRELLGAQQRHYVELSGSWEWRWNQALEAVERLIRSESSPPECIAGDG